MKLNAPKKVKKGQEIYSTLNCPTGPDQSKIQIMFHKKSPVQDFIKMTLSLAKLFPI